MLLVRKTKQKNSWIGNIGIQLGLILLSSVLFFFSFPNPVFKNGLFFLAYFAYIPILLVIHKNSISSCIAYGAVYGCVTYALFNYWLWTFHPVAGLVTYSIYLLYMALLFPVLKLAEVLFKKHSYLVQWVIWLAYEYLRTTGFVGYSYGVTGYSQWRFIPLIQIASVTGVWGVSALVTFPSFWIAAAFRGQGTGDRGQGIVDSNLSENKEIKLSDKNPCPLSLVPCPLIKKNIIPAFIWLTAMIATLIYGFTVNKDYSDAPRAKIALIQHNTDPWEAARAPNSRLKREAYKKDLEILIRLSDKAIAANPDVQLVVWPETAFVPRIYWHSTYRDDRNSWLVVKELLDYLNVQTVPFLIGNDDARMDRAKNPNEKEKHRVDYNAALLFEKGEITKTYRKMHLVPFTEHFPYKKQFPKIYKALENADTNFWEKGTEETVFTLDGFSFSAPICFEDTFGYLSRNFTKRGADILINMTNDAWANSLSAQNQHLSIAVFRTVENRRSMVRSTVSGQTCAIDPSGRITALATPFTETWLTADVPLVKDTTFFTLYGDFLGIFQCIMAILLLLSGGLWYTIRKRKKE